MPQRGAGRMRVASLYSASRIVRSVLMTKDTVPIACEWDSLPMGIVLVQADVMYVNAAVEKITGYSRADLTSVDSYVRRLLTRECAEGTTAQRHALDLWRAAKGPQLTLPVICRDGRSIWIEHQMGPSVDQEVWTLRDVSDRVSADRIARKQTELLKRVSRLGDIGGWEHILETDEMIWSEQLYRIHEVDPKTKICTALIESLYSKESIARLYAALMQSVEAGTPYEIELPFVTADGKQRWARMSGEVDVENGQAKRWVGIMQDVTERYKTNAELREARLTAEAANIAKSEFLANMSHEIRTPMNGVIGMAELLLETSLTDTQRDYAETVGHSAKALLTIINDILDFSKIEAGKLELECIDMDLHDTVYEAGRLLAVQAHAKNLELTIEIDPAVPTRVRGDAGRLRQILLNLGGNAVKFTERGEIAISVKMLSRDPTVGLHFEIRDTGIGIPAHRIQSLFQPFSQVDSSTTRKFGGTGLGLSIVQRLVRLMGGESGVRSDEGRGSCFWFSAHVVRVDKPAPAHLEVPILMNMPVLLVDNNSTNRRVLTTLLLHYGCEPVCVDSMNEAIALIQMASTSMRPFRTALIDQRMILLDDANIGGLIAAQRMLTPTRLILLTTSERRDAISFAELGFAGYLLKPIVPRELLQLLLMTPESSSKPGYTQSQPNMHTVDSARPTAGENRRILVAEDNVVNQKVVRRVLENLGCKVTIADNGLSAVAAWEAEEFDLILMDCQMPGLDGYQAATEIRRRESDNSRIPIVALTAHAMKGADLKCLEAGMDDHLTKPIDKNLLRAVIDRYLLPKEALLEVGVSKIALHSR